MALVTANVRDSQQKHFKPMMTQRTRHEAPGAKTKARTRQRLPLSVVEPPHRQRPPSGTAPATEHSSVIRTERCTRGRASSSDTESHGNKLSSYSCSTESGQPAPQIHTTVIPSVSRATRGRSRLNLSINCPTADSSFACNEWCVTTFQRQAPLSREVKIEPSTSASSTRTPHRDRKLRLEPKSAKDSTRP